MDDLVAGLLRCHEVTYPANRTVSSAGAPQAFKGIASGVALVCYLGLAACATTNSNGMGGLATAEAAQVNQVCQYTMGIAPGGADFDACKSSLAAAIVERKSDGVLLAAYARCGAEGRQPGTPDISLCVLGKIDPGPVSETAAPEAQGTKAAAPDAQGPIRVKSINNASNDEIHRRAERSCALVGFEPGSGHFINCASNLQASIDQSAIPPTN